ncbi:MAG: CusA/CzcA family heavy metal efflux RND transporter [Oceanospirillaceae bacterium]|nr:CusA/CzcA family heavy metal efflux RND transporter [Oceanospirillaceae bacterium]MCP5349391.1 CusA/CzcA family heavy metal efflux RND transporter [Oceanospirillaceae bacterium]
MLDFLLHGAIERRRLMMALCALLALWGIYSYQQLNIDAVPDITNVQVQINTLAEGYSPLETEQRISQPLENNLTGLPGLLYSRSLSRYGLSQITLIFADGTDIYDARNQISNRLASLRSLLPQGLEPELGPVTTGIGEILSYSLKASPQAQQEDGSAYDSMALRELHDWVIRPQLARLQGIAEINSMGGYGRELHVVPDQGLMLAHGVSFADIQQALLANNANHGSGFMEYNGQQLLIRSTGQLRETDDISRIAIRSGATPLFIGDIARIEIGHSLRSGAATVNGEERVLGTAMLLTGSNAHRVEAQLRARIRDIQRALPAGIELEILYGRSKLIDKVMATVQKNLLEGATLVILVLLLMLGSMRAALITAAVIPLAMFATLGGMQTAGVSANLMSLGALDFGLIVDGAVIIVENAVRRLGIARQGGELALRERLKVVFDATREVIRPSLFGVIIITLVYLPLFALSGVEGKMFQPMAATVVMALVAALVLSLTFVPAAVALFLSASHSHRTSRAMHIMQQAYRRLLNSALHRPRRVLLSALLFMLLCITLIGRTGSEFVPSLNEGDIALHAMRIPGTSLQQSVQMQMQLEAEILRFPQVENVFSKLGTAEVATDPMPPSVADTFVMLKARESWPDPNLPREDLIEQIEQAISQLPGNNYEFTQPIQMRFNELIAGVRSDMGVLIMGDNLETLRSLARETEALLGKIPGAADVKTEQVDGLPVITLLPDTSAMARYGISLAELQAEFAAASGFAPAGYFYAGERRYPIQVRGPMGLQPSPHDLQNLHITLPGGGYVPIKEVARIELQEMPAQISRENGKRRIIVSANVRGRDLGSFVQETQQTLQQQLPLPTGYWLEYSGTFKQLESATQRLSMVVPLVLLLIFALLCMAFNSLRDALLILSGIPFALCGGVIALWLRGIPFSISAAVGFIALSGIAVLNGLVLLSFIRERWREWGNLQRAIIEGATTRLRPVLMTALVAALGFIPMALNTGTGAEVQRPLASVVIGGIISSTLLTLVLLPVLFQFLNRSRHPG